jgi:hypothetical protein
VVVVVHSSIGRKIELKIVAPRRRRGGGSDQGHIPSRKPELLHFEKKKSPNGNQVQGVGPETFLFVHARKHCGNPGCQRTLAMSLVAPPYVMSKAELGLKGKPMIRINGHKETFCSGPSGPVDDSTRSHPRI